MFLDQISMISEGSCDTGVMMLNIQLCVKEVNILKYIEKKNYFKLVLTISQY